MASAWLAITSAIVVAIVSSTLTYQTTKRLARHSSSAAYIGRQISELYGPLYALSRAGRTSFVEFRTKYGPGRKHLLDDPDNPPTDEEVAAWKYWLTNVFMPLNRRMVDVLLQHTDLIEGDDMPESLVKFFAHVNGYEVIMARWADNDFAALTSVIDHPGPILDDYISSTYRELKRRHVALLGIEQKG